MTQAHTTRAHATLAPSAAKRWSACPASVRATKDLPDNTSSAAAEGTAAHELASQCLEWGHDPAAYLGKYVDIKADGVDYRFLEAPFDTDDELRFFEIDEEMADGVAMYVEHARALARGGADVVPKDVMLDVEQRLDMTDLHPEIFGTGDATVYVPETKHLHVIDFKYGKGVAVDADENPQLLLYAAGAVRRHHNMKVEGLTVHIVQPRAPHPKGPIRSYEIDLIDLIEFEQEISAAAKRTDDPDAPFKAGPHCHDTFCKLQGACAANRAYRLEAAGAEFGSVDTDTVLPSVEAMTPAQRARVLREADGLLSYVKAVQEFEHAQAMRGNLPEGFKLVAKRANRKWKDEGEAIEAMLARAIEPYQPAKLKSPAMAESGFPGKNKAEREKAMADLVVKQSSGFNLVPVEDSRPAVNIGAGADFDAVETA